MFLAHNDAEANMSAKPIVAATDGSEESLRAVVWAAREAVLRGAPLRIVSAAELLPRMVGGHAMSNYDAVADTIRQHRDQALAAATERVAQTAPGLIVDADHLEGSPAEAVTSAGSGALMLVTGSRGAGAFAAMVLGSVSRYAATHAACPVVVVREDAGAAHRQVGVGVGDLDHCASLLARTDLVVLGRQAVHHGPGTVIHAVLNHAHGPVVTVPAAPPASG